MKLPVSKVLGGNVSDRQLGEDDLRSGSVELLEFVVQDAPLGIDDGLVLLQEAERKSM